MGTHWTDRRASKTAIAHALRDRGWTLFGYTADASDSMTDYWAPAHWDGIATKGGAVVVVDVDGKWTGGTMGRSGHVETESVPVSDGPCPTCAGSGADPALEGWTLKRAQAEPRAWHDAEEAVRRSRGEHGVALMRDVVSPLHFNDDGRPWCNRCHGKGELLRYESRPNGVTWPTFQGNPPRRNWHLERDGSILESGIGALAFGSANSYGSGPRAEKLKAFIDRIDAAAQGYTLVPAGDGEKLEPGTVQTRPSARRPDYLEIVFPSKPGVEVRNELKRRGFRWAPSSSCWYGPAAAAHGLELGA